MVSHTVNFTGMMVFALISQRYHRISVLVPVLIRVPEYLYTSTSTSTSTVILELTSKSTVRVPEIQCSSTASTSIEYEYSSPDYDTNFYVIGGTEDSVGDDKLYHSDRVNGKKFFSVFCFVCEIENCLCFVKETTGHVNITGCHLIRVGISSRPYNGYSYTWKNGIYVNSLRPSDTHMLWWNWFRWWLVAC